MSQPRSLVVVRHAKAEAAVAGAEDHEQALAPRGRRDAVALGEWLAEQAPPPDLVLCSDALRAVQTWDLASARLPAPPPVQVRSGLYLADPGTLLAAVRAVPPQVRVLVVVGHQPTQSALVLGLAGPGSDAEAVRRVRDGFATSAVAVLEVPGPWDALQPQGARLVAMAVPRG